MRTWKIRWGKIMRSCILKGRCVCLCKEDSHCRNDELNMEEKALILLEFCSLGTAWWNWAENYNAIGASAGLIPNKNKVEENIVNWETDRFNRMRDLSKCVFKELFLVALRQTLSGAQGSAETVQRLQCSHLHVNGEFRIGVQKCSQWTLRYTIVWKSLRMMP